MSPAEPRVESKETVGEGHPTVAPTLDSEEKVYSVADIAKFLGQSAGTSPGPVGGLSKELLHSGNSSRVSSRAASSVTARTLAKDQLLNRLSSQFVQGGLQETLSIQDLSLAGLLKGEKALLPVNFGTIFTGCGVDEEEVVGTGQFQGRLVWHSGKNGSPKRPTADRLTRTQIRS